MTDRLNCRQGTEPLCILSALMLMFALGSVSPTVKAQSDLFADSKMAVVNLQGVRARLGQPIQVTEGVGHLWFPTIAKFPGGELIVIYALVADTNENPHYLSGFQISRDEGKTWGHRYDMIPEFGSTILLPRDDGSIVLIPHLLYRETPEDKQNFHAAFTRFEPGGRRVIIEPMGIRVVDWPWLVDAHDRRLPSKNWHVRLRFDGSILEMQGRLLATGFATKQGDSFQRNVVFASEDGGHTWRYWSTIAEPSIMPASPEKGAGGPSETAMIQLADGDLMSVFRVGSGRNWNLRRAYSSDGARSWARAEAIPAYSVEPSMVRIKNGTILLSTGRPGIYLWVSIDPRAERWQSINILEHHNRWAADDTYRISPEQTTAYTELVEVAPNRLLLVYDRVAFGWKPTPTDSGERSCIFVLPIMVELK